MFHERFKVGGGQSYQAAADQFLLKGLEVSRQASQFLLVRGDKRFLEGFRLDGPKRAELLLMSAAPSNECGFGNTELGRDTGVAQALNTEFQEFGMCGGGMHGGETTET